jgi:hypothetical protein
MGSEVLAKFFVEKDTKENRYIGRQIGVLREVQKKLGDTSLNKLCNFSLKFK